MKVIQAMLMNNPTENLFKIGDDLNVKNCKLEQQGTTHNTMVG